MNNSVSFKGVIFDVDATLVDTTSVIDDIWKTWAEKKSISFEDVYPHIHGRKVNETLEAVNPKFVNEADIAEVKGIAIEKMKAANAIPEALNFVNTIPRKLWGIATSGPKSIATTSLIASGFELPSVMVCGEDVSKGKPHAEPFILAAQKLGFKPSQCIAFEDSPVGVESAKSAGCYTVALKTSHSEKELQQADLIVNGFSDLNIVENNDRLSITLKK